MSEVNERIELLIARGLDGELDEADRRELEAGLESSPEARRMAEEMDRIDALAGAALQSVLQPRETGWQPARNGTNARPYFAGRSPGWLWYVPGAIAAALALFLWLSPTDQRLASTSDHVGPAALTGSKAHPFIKTPQAEVRPASHGLGFQDRSLNRDAVWVMADDGRIYLIERHSADVLTYPGVESNEWNMEGGI